MVASVATGARVPSLSKYEVLEEIGHGGMASVYRARDPRLGRDVAIKVIAPSLLTPDSERRFQTEAQVVAQMDHPSIVSINDFGHHEGSLFFVMPVVEGESLRSLLRRGSLTLGMVLDIIIKSRKPSNTAMHEGSCIGTSNRKTSWFQ